MNKIFLLVHIIRDSDIESIFFLNLFLSFLKILYVKCLKEFKKQIGICSSRILMKYCLYRSETLFYMLYMKMKVLLCKHFSFSLFCLLNKKKNKEYVYFVFNFYIIIINTYDYAHTLIM